MTKYHALKSFARVVRVGKYFWNLAGCVFLCSLLRLKGERKVCRLLADSPPSIHSKSEAASQKTFDHKSQLALGSDMGHPCPT